MAFIFEKLAWASLVLAVIYLILSILVFKKLRDLHKHSPDLNTRKLFVMTCLLSVVLRTMSFGSMAALDFSEIHYSVHSDSNQKYDDETTGNETFFEKASFVLFDFPDFCFVSAYVLLLVVWAESFLQSRRHWLSSVAFRRVWLLGYLIFNIILYGSQVALYSFLFIPTINQDVLSDMIYITLTVFNLVLPISWIVIYLYLSVKFAGFPFASSEAKDRLLRLSTLTSLWTFTRMGWGAVTMTSVIQGWLVEINRSKIFYSFVIIGIFCIAEVSPIVISLRSELLNSFSEIKPNHRIYRNIDANAILRSSFSQEHTNALSDFEHMNSTNSGSLSTNDAAQSLLQNQYGSIHESDTRLSSLRVPVQESFSKEPTLSPIIPIISHSHSHSITHHNKNSLDSSHDNDVYNRSSSLDSSRLSYASAHSYDEDLFNRTTSNNSLSSWFRHKPDGDRRNDSVSNSHNQSYANNDGNKNSNFLFGWFGF